MNSVSNVFNELNSKFYELLQSLTWEQWNREILGENLKIKDLIFKHLHDSWDSLNQLSQGLQSDDIHLNHPEEFDSEFLITNLKFVHQQLNNYFINIPFFYPKNRSEINLVVAADLLKIYSETWLVQHKIRHALGKIILLDSIFYFPFLEYCFRLLPLHLSKFSFPNRTMISIAVVGEETLLWQLVFDNSNWLFTESQKNAAVQIYIDQNIAWLLFSGALEIYEVSQYWQIIGNQDLGRQVLSFRPFE